MIAELPSVAASAMVAAANGAAATPQNVTVFDIAKFQDAYARAGQGVSGASSQHVGGSMQTQESEGFRAVLNTLNSLNGRAAGLGDNAGISASHDMSPGQMLMLTVRCHEFMFQCELTANVANRSSDGVQQLFRQQS